MARYTLAYMCAQVNISVAQNVRCTIVYANMLLGERKNAPRFLILEALLMLQVKQLKAEYINFMAKNIVTCHLLQHNLEMWKFLVILVIIKPFLFMKN